LFAGDMTTYSIVLFIHVIATLGLIGAMTVEAMALWQFGRAHGMADARAWLDPMPRMRLVASLCLLVLFLSGGYLTDRLSMWQLAWPKIAVAVVLAFGALAGLSGVRLGRIQKALRNADGDGRVLDGVAPFLKISLSLRTGLVLAAVFLMTVKPNLAHSLEAVLALVVIFLGAGSLGRNAKLQGSTEARGLERSAR
jgi:hypothetical protein